MLCRAVGGSAAFLDGSTGRSVSTLWQPTHIQTNNTLTSVHNSNLDNITSRQRLTSASSTAGQSQNPVSALDRTNVPNKKQYKSMSIVSAYESSSASSSSGSTGTNFQPPTDMQSSKFTRAPPPTFSGNRSEWAEFRAIWKR